MFKNPGLLSLQGSNAGLKTGLVPAVSGQGMGEDKDTWVPGGSVISKGVTQSSASG